MSVQRHNVLADVPNVPDGLSHLRVLDVLLWMSVEKRDQASPLTDGIEAYMAVVTG